MHLSPIIHKYMAEIQKRKTQPVFIWWERFGMLVFFLWLYDAVIGFQDSRYVDMVYILSWVLTATALADFAWFAYRHGQEGG